MKKRSSFFSRKRLWFTLLTFLLLLSLAACGQERPSEGKSPLEGAKSLRISVEWERGGLIEVASDILEEPRRIVPERLEEELPALLGDALPSTLERIDFWSTEKDELAQRVLALIREIPGGAQLAVTTMNGPWPERLTAENMIFWSSDLNKVLTETYPRVRALQLIYCRNVTEKTIVGAFPNLLDLRINTGNLIGWDQPMPTVEHAYFGNCAGLTFEMLGAYFPALTELGLGLGTFPEDLGKISQTGIKTLVIYRYDEEVREAWTALEDRYELFKQYDLSVETDREALAALLPYSTQEIVTHCIDQGIQVYLQVMPEYNELWIPDPLEYSPGP